MNRVRSFLRFAANVLRWAVLVIAVAVCGVAGLVALCGFAVGWMAALVVAWIVSDA